MQKTLVLLLVFSITSVQSFAGATSILGKDLMVVPQEESWQVSFAPEQLENLLAPVALYPDPLLAQVLLAATFPDQVDQAARTMRASNNRYDIESTDWDVSVKAVAHYPSVLAMMADKIDWTTSVGQAYVNQSTDVMDAIQRLRRQARSVGNLVTSPQQEIVETDGYIYIYPATPQYIYVPTYDPAVVYFHRPAFFLGPVIGFGIGFAIGAWLNHDCDWRQHRVFYHGWEHGPAWVQRSRPFIRFNDIYVGPRHREIIVNRGVMDHHVNYGALDRYRAIHRDTDFGGVRRQRGGFPEHRIPPVAGQSHPDNQIIRRNIDRSDQRIDANRGRGVVVDPGRGSNQPPPAPQLGNRWGGLQHPPNSVFRGTPGIDSRDASRRGQLSRDHERRLGSLPEGRPNFQQKGPPPNQRAQQGRPNTGRPR